MLASIHIMFVNEKIIRIYSFCPFLTMKHKTNASPPHDPLKYPTVWGGGDKQNNHIQY